MNHKYPFERTENANFHFTLNIRKKNRQIVPLPLTLPPNFTQKCQNLPFPFALYSGGHLAFADPAVTRLWHARALSNQSSR